MSSGRYSIANSEALSMKNWTIENLERKGISENGSLTSEAYEEIKGPRSQVYTPLCLRIFLVEKRLVHPSHMI